MTDVLCRTGKIQYATSGEAAQTITHLRARDKSRKKTTPYKCPFCREWHLGNTDESARKGPNQRRAGAKKFEAGR
jgi:hypothetical protein